MRINKLVTGFSVLLVLAGLVSAGAPPTAAASQDTEHIPDHVRDLPFCDPDPSWDGHISKEKEAEVANDPPVCRVDPQETVFLADPGMDTYPIPSGTGYHHNGAQTSGKMRGATGIIKVTNPTVDHTWSGQFEFVVSRWLAKTSGSSNWHEVGWAEFNGPEDIWRTDKQYVYTYDTENPGWHFYTDYVLNNDPSHSGFRFKVERCQSSGTYGACTYFYWNGWQFLHMSLAPHGCDSNGCYIEEYTEIYSEDATPHPALTADNSGALWWSTIQIKKQNGTWDWWYESVAPSYSGAVPPYRVCWKTKWNKFDVYRNDANYTPSGCVKIDG